MANPRPKPSRSLTVDLTTASDKGLSIKHHPTLPLAIVNYTNHISLSRKGWDDLSLAARSLVVETTTGSVISRGLPKFFNYHEKFAYKPTGKEHAWVIEQKIDGSLISVFSYRGEWIVISRSAFDSPHALAARRVLDKRYPGALDNIMDRGRTYVFELVDPALPVKIRYEKEDLFILAVVSRDGSEQVYDFDWKTLPFSRPKIHDAVCVVPKQLSQLDLPNEEGFVVKYWATSEDRYPERVKIKLERYLLGGPLFEKAGGAGNKKGKQSLSQPSMVLSLAPPPPEPPSTTQILDIYTQNRLKIHHFNSPTVADIMRKHRRDTLSSLECIADDYGGLPWLNKVGNVWDRIDDIFTSREAELVAAISTLLSEGYKPNIANAREAGVRRRFERRLAVWGTNSNRRSDETVTNVNLRALREALWAWYFGWPAFRQVACFVEGVRLEVPQDLKSMDGFGIVLGSE